MKAIRLNNTTIEMEFDSEEQRKQFVSLVSYEVPGSKWSASVQSGMWDGTKCFLTPKNRVKSGIFKSLFPTQPLVYDSSFTDLAFSDIPLFKKNPKFEQRQYQLDAVNTILKHKRGLISAVMGSGKTLIAASVCSYHLSQGKNKILFVVYDRNILAQTIKNFTAYGFKVSQFGDSIKDLTGDIVVATIQSLSKIIKPAIILKHITFVIMDEAHHSKSKTSKSIVTKIPNCEYFIGLTATPYKENTLELAELVSVLGPVIYEYGFAEAIKDNKVVPVKAFFLDIPVDLDVKEQVFHRRNYKVIWDTAIRDNIGRNKSMGQILSTLTEILDTTQLVLVDRVEHGLQVANSFNQFPNLKVLAMYGEDNIILRELKKESLSTDNTNVLISTVIKEGIDFKLSPVVAVNASGRKSFIPLIQFLGRVTRKNEKFKSFRIYLDSIDRYHPSLLAHSMERVEACKQFGVDVTICKSMNDLLVEVIKHYKQCFKVE